MCQSWVQSIVHSVLLSFQIVPPFFISVFSSRDGTTGIDVRSACVNPVCDAFWHWKNSTYHVRGVVNGTYELVRERNGPFAGKKINRPVAKYDYCHKVCAAFVGERLRVKFEDPDGGKADKAIFDSLRINGRKVFMAGLLREKCIERGLTLPDSGGDVKMRSFLDSLKHACKVPNTEQPFACMDLMFLATLVDQLLGFKQGSVLHSSKNINGMTAEWPLAAAFYVYQNGLWINNKYLYKDIILKEWSVWWIKKIFGELWFDFRKF